MAGIRRIAWSAGDVAITPATSGPLQLILGGAHAQFFWLAARALRARSPTSSSIFANEKYVRSSLLRSSGAQFADATDARTYEKLGLRPGAHDLPLPNSTLAATAPILLRTARSADARSHGSVPAPTGYRTSGCSADSIWVLRTTAESGSDELRQVPRIDPMMISGNPMARPTVIGSFSTTAPSSMATAGLT